MSDLGDEIVVFILGMRINKPLKIGLWWPVMIAMHKMLNHLDEHPEKGLLGYRTAFVPPLMIQYWRSFEDLARFARNVDDPHLDPVEAVQPPRRQVGRRRYLARDVPGEDI